MAEAFVNVTEGSGKKLHAFDKTIGANTVLDEIVQLGEPYLATYRIATIQTSIATAASHLLQIMAGSTLNVYVRSIRVYQGAVATTAAINSLLIFRLTTAGSGGTPVTPLPLDGTDAASGATAMTLPTAKGTEAATFLEAAACYWLQTIPTAVDFNPLRASWDFETLRSKGLRIAAGTSNGIAIKVNTANAGATCNVVAEIVEANF